MVQHDNDGNWGRVVVPLRNLREGAHFNLCTEYTNLEFLQQCILSCSL